MAEPLGVAFVEIEPVATGFRAKTEAQLRGALVGSTSAARTATTAQEGLTVAENQGAIAAQRKAAAEAEAAAAARAHATSAQTARNAILAQTFAVSGLRGASLGVSPAFLAGTAAAIGFFKSLELADEFAEQMHRIETATHASTAELEAASATARALGRDLDIPGTTAVDSAEAINLLARSGFDLQGAMTAARGSLLLAAASGETLEESVGQIDRVLDAFNLTAADSERIADAVAVGLKFTAGNAREFSQALFTLAPAADSVGLSLEDTNTLVLQLTESGLSASQAAGTLRQAFLKLVENGKGVRDGLHSINLETADLFDQFGNLRPDAFVRLAEAVEHLNRRQRLAVLTQIFTRRAALGVIRIIEQEREGYERMSEQARLSGVAQEDAAARAQTAGGQFRELKGDLADAGTEFGQFAQGPAKAVIGVLRLNAQMLRDMARAANFAAGFVHDLADAAADAVGPLDDMYAAAKRFTELSRNPVGGFFDFVKDIPGEVKDAATGLKQAINLNVAGIADIPGIREFSQNLDLLVGGFEKGHAGVKREMDGMVRDVGIGVTEMEHELTAGAPKIATAASKLALAIAEAQAAGDTGGELAGLRKRESGLERFIKRQEALPQTKSRVATLIKANNQLAAVRAQIAAILSGIQSDAEADARDAQDAKDRIVKAADDRDRAFITAIERTRSTREGSVSAAGQTDATLRDDIRANVKLRNFLRNAIQSTRARIREARAAGRETEALAAELASLRQARNQVRREIERLQADAAAQAAETRVESTQLDLQILETRVGDDPTRGQTNKLIAAHLKVIAALKRAQKLAKGRTLEVKRLQLEIEQEKAAIRDLRKSQASATSTDTQNFLRQQFEFLQTIHGFSSNLLGNLIPGSALGGLVGGTATSSTLGRPAGLAVPGGAGTRPTAGISTKPVSAGQGNQQIQLLREIRNLLRSEHGRGDHPEVHRARRKGAAAGDFSYQGTHGG